MKTHYQIIPLVSIFTIGINSVILLACRLRTANLPY